MDKALEELERRAWVIPESPDCGKEIMRANDEARKFRREYDGVSNATARVNNAL